MVKLQSPTADGIFKPVLNVTNVLNLDIYLLTTQLTYSTMNFLAKMSDTANCACF